MKEEYDILQIAKDFIKAVETRASFEDLSKFYHEDIIQIEYPNAITKNTTTRTIEDLRNASAKGKQVLHNEVYEIMHAYVQENTVIIEAVWKGTLAIPIGNLGAGDLMTAHFAQVFNFKDGKIYRQRNYDCFDPF